MTIEVTKINETKWYIKDHNSEYSGFLRENPTCEEDNCLEIFSRSGGKMFLQIEKKKRFEDKDDAIDYFVSFVEMKSLTKTIN